MSPTTEIKAIASLVSIHFYLHKLYSYALLQIHSLPPNYILNSLLKSRNLNTQESHWLLLNNITPIQQSSIKEILVDIDNKFNKVFLSFSLFNHKFLPGNRLTDIFPNYFSFYSSNRSNNQDIKRHLRHLNKITIQVLLDLHSVVIISNVSIKNQVAISIYHIYSHNKPIIKTLYYAVRIMSTKAELLTIRYGIIQATYLSNINQIILIMDSIHAVKKIFDSSTHPHQLQSVLISQVLREFFNKGNNYCIEFWDCSNNQKWNLHSTVDKETKNFNLSPIFLCKLL